MEAVLLVSHPNDWLFAHFRNCDWQVCYVPMQANFLKVDVSAAEYADMEAVLLALPSR